jgi:hypothetical protein
MAMRTNGRLEGHECETVPLIEFRRGNIDESQQLVHRVVGMRGLAITVHHVPKEAVGAAAHRVQASRVPYRDRTIVRDLVSSRRLIDRGTDARQHSVQLCRSLQLTGPRRCPQR